MDSAGAVTNAYRYTGQEWDGDVSGLYNYRARYYDATIGRFNQEDPLLQSPQIQSAIPSIACLTCSGTTGFPLLQFTNPQELDPYVYVTNNPINRIDPLGTFGLSPFAPNCAIGLTLYFRKQLHTDGGPMQGRDKFVHCLTACIITNECYGGIPYPAIGLGTGYEYIQIFDRGSGNRLGGWSLGDIGANRAGADLGTKPCVDCWSACNAQYP